MTKTIMTVDDSASVRLMVSLTLKEAGYDVIEASDGQDALSKIKGKNFNLILTDLNMPNMGGIDLIKNVRGNLKYRYIPIILLTTESQQEKKTEGKNAGATGWIVKPFKADQLLSVVRRVIG